MKLFMVWIFILCFQPLRTCPVVASALLMWPEGGITGTGWRPVQSGRSSPRTDTSALWMGRLCAGKDGAGTCARALCVLIWRLRQHSAQKQAVLLGVTQCRGSAALPTPASARLGIRGTTAQRWWLSPAASMGSLVFRKTLCLQRRLDEWLVWCSNLQVSSPQGANIVSIGG